MDHIGERLQRRAQLDGEHELSDEEAAEAEAAEGEENAEGEAGESAESSDES